MRRRELLGSLAAARRRCEASSADRSLGCDCALAPRCRGSAAVPPGSDVFKDVGSKLRITDMKVFGVTLDEKIARADRPYVFVKLETNQGVVGWGEATLEGKAAAAMACVNDLKDFIIGSDPMQVEHLYQLMYIGSFYRGGPVLGLGDLRHRPGALGHSRQGSWTCPSTRCWAVPSIPAGCAAIITHLPDARGGARAARQDQSAGVTALKFQLPDLLEWVETNAKLTARRQAHGDAAGRAWDRTSISPSTSMRGRAPRSRRLCCAKSSRTICCSPRRSARRRICQRWPARPGGRRHPSPQASD